MNFQRLFLFLFYLLTIRMLSFVLIIQVSKYETNLSHDFFCESFVYLLLK